MAPRRADTDRRPVAALHRGPTGGSRRDRAGAARGAGNAGRAGCAGDAGSDLAGRVATELLRYGVVADDSAGEKLSRHAAGGIPAPAGRRGGRGIGAGAAAGVAEASAGGGRPVARRLPRRRARAGIGVPARPAAKPRLIRAAAGAGPGTHRSRRDCIAGTARSVPGTGAAHCRRRRGGARGGAGRRDRSGRDAWPPPTSCPARPGCGQARKARPWRPGWPRCRRRCRCCRTSRAPCCRGCWTRCWKAPWCAADVPCAGGTAPSIRACSSGACWRRGCKRRTSWCWAAWPKGCGRRRPIRGRGCRGRCGRGRAAVARGNRRPVGARLHCMRLRGAGRRAVLSAPVDGAPVVPARWLTRLETLAGRPGGRPAAASGRRPGCARWISRPMGLGRCGRRGRARPWRCGRAGFR